MRGAAVTGTRPEDGESHPTDPHRTPGRNATLVIVSLVLLLMIFSVVAAVVGESTVAVMAATAACAGVGAIINRLLPGGAGPGPASPQELDVRELDHGAGSGS